MVQSPSWEANWFAASQEVPRISRNPKVHYRNHKRPPPVSILGQPNPVHIPPSHLLEIHPNIIHPSTPRSPQWSTSLRFPHQDPIHPPLLTHTSHMPSPITNSILHFWEVWFRVHDTMTRLGAVRPRNRGFVIGSRKNVLCSAEVQTGSEAHREQNVWGVKLTTHLHLLSRLRMTGSIPALPHKPPLRKQRQLCLYAKNHKFSKNLTTT